MGLGFKVMGLTGLRAKGFGCWGLACFKAKPEPVNLYTTTFPKPYLEVHGWSVARWAICSVVPIFCDL